jgi:hypothetical protein
MSMKMLTLIGLFALLAPQGAAPAQPAGCAPRGNVQFVCGLVGPEDLVEVPNSNWIIASGDAAPGAITLVDKRTRSVSPLYPSPNMKQQLDAKTYDTCPGPIDPQEKDKFRAHGVALRQGRGSLFTLYVVHHGNRESIEVFEFDPKAAAPALTWVGCAVAPDPIGLNSIVALPEGGFATTNFLPRNAANGIAGLRSGQKNGELWEWHTKTGWKIVPGSEASGANGIEISKDGKTFYMAGWGNQVFIRFSRGATPGQRDEVPLGFRLDNLRWAPDGATLIGAGQQVGPDGAAVVASRVVRIDPKTLKVQDLVNYPSGDAFDFATGAIQIGKQIWVGSVRGEKLAIFPVP